MMLDNELLDKYIRDAVPGVPVFNTDEVALDPRYIINDDGEMQITEFAVVPRRDNE